ncbi:ferredoxin [Streptomyces sp. NPDC057616]|uniref:ferredoxin n=1 Tax=Streptomyces sp. NPDC057616 TaxID=3346183 RepID=UPI0036CD3791
MTIGERGPAALVRRGARRTAAVTPAATAGCFALVGTLQADADTAADSGTGSSASSGDNISSADRSSATHPCCPYLRRPDVDQRITVDRTSCEGHALCAELLPEHITLDEWGYPLVAGTPVPARTVGRARRAAADAPPWPSS